MDIASIFRNPPPLDPSQWFALEDVSQLSGRLPNSGELMSFVTCKTISAVEVFVLLLGDGQCDRSQICSFNVSREGASYLEAAVADGSIGLLDVFMSNAMPHFQPDEAIPILQALVDRLPNRVSLRVANLHAKAYCLAMANGDNWVIETSANFASNAMIEIYTIWNSAERLFWHAEWTAALVR